MLMPAGRVKLGSIFQGKWERCIWVTGVLGKLQVQPAEFIRFWPSLIPPRPAEGRRRCGRATAAAGWLRRSRFRCERVLHATSR